MLITNEKLKDQPNIAKELSDSERANLIISVIKLENAQYEILSRYGDPTWHLTGMCTSTRKANGIMDFKKVPETFRNISKEVLYAYQQQGREGEVRPKPATLINIFNYVLKFLLFLQEEKISKLSEISSVVCLRYVNYLKAYKRKNGASLTVLGLASYFVSVEWLYEMSQQASDSMLEHPWPESSSGILSGKIGIVGRSSRTLIIPEEIITKIFQAAWKKIDEGEKLLVVRDNL